MRCREDFKSTGQYFYFQVLICDNMALPYKDDSFDAVLSIAVIHHIATTERRVRALRELARILRVGGRIIIRYAHLSVSGLVNASNTHQRVEYGAEASEVRVPGRADPLAQVGYPLIGQYRKYSALIGHHQARPRLLG